MDTATTTTATTTPKSLTGLGDLPVGEPRSIVIGAGSPMTLIPVNGHAIRFWPSPYENRADEWRCFTCPCYFHVHEVSDEANVEMLVKHCSSDAADQTLDIERETFLVIFQTAGWGGVWGYGGSLEEAKRSAKARGADLRTKHVEMKFGVGSMFGGVDAFGRYSYFGEEPSILSAPN